MISDLTPVPTPVLIPVFLVTIAAMVLVDILSGAADVSSANPADPAPLSSAADIEQRLSMWNRGADLLDAGQNEQAAAYFTRLLQEQPGHLEIAEGLLTAYTRTCSAGSALILLQQEGIATDGSARECYQLYLSGARLRQERKFSAAAADFREAAALYSAQDDNLSAAVCFLATASCHLRARNTPEAERAAAAVTGILASAPGADRLLARAEVVIAVIYNARDHLAPADSLYRIILQKATEHRYRQVKSDCLRGLGNLHEKRSQIVEAVDFYRLSLAAERIMGSRQGTAVMLNNLGQTETRLRNLEQAQHHLEEARELVLACDLDDLLGNIYYGLGAIAETAGNRQEALTLFEQSFTEHRRQGNEWGELAARQRLAYNLSLLGEYPEAIAHYQSCLAAYEESGNLFGLNWILGGLALANHKLGYLQQAEKYYRRAQEVNIELGDRKSGAWCLNSLGVLHSLQGEYRQALVMAYEALAIHDELGDQAGSGRAHASIAAVYRHLGDYNKSQEQYEQAFSLAQKISSKELLQSAVGGMASLYAAAGRVDLAESYYLRALESARQWSDNVVIIWALNDLASHYLETGCKSKARKYLNEASTLLADQGQLHVRSQTYYLLAKSADFPEQAIANATRALTIAMEAGLPEMEWYCLSDLGVYHLSQGDLTQSKSFQLQAIQTVESLRHKVGSDELRHHMLRPTLLPYERMIAAILGKSGNSDRSGSGAAAAEAFAFSERSRAQILAGRLRSAFERLEGEPVQEFAAEEHDIQATITFLQARLQDDSLPAAERKELLTRIEKLERQFSLLRIRIAGRDNAYATMVYPTAESMDVLLATLHPNERMLAYFLGSQQSYLFSAADGQVTAYLLPPRAEIEAKVQLFLRLLGQWSATTAGGPDAENTATAVEDSVGLTDLPPEILATAQRELYRLLIGPAAADFGSSETLIIVPDGLLHRLPFALLRNELRYLLEEHELFFAPSLRTLRYLRVRATSRRQSRPPLDIIAAGCEGVPQSADKGANRLHPFVEAPVTPLPHAADEAKRVAGLFHRSVVLTGDDADERSFKNSPLSETNILHIAAHSYADDEDVRHSFIVMNPSTSRLNELPATTEDGLFQWHEVAALRLNASLVTLAACRSADGVLAFGEGITGLTQAFLYAGGNCVLAAQADIPDWFASRLMVEFYRNLRQGLSTAASLRTAQLEAITWPVATSAPTPWAGFIVVGDGATVVAAPTKPSLRTVLATALFMAALLTGSVMIIRTRIKRKSR